MLCIVMGLPWNENGIIDTFHPLPLHQPIRFLGPGFGSFTVGRGEVTVNVTYVYPYFTPITVNRERPDTM